MIEVHNFTTFEINEGFLKNIGEEILKGEKKEGVLFLSMVGPRKIKWLNLEFKKKNRVVEFLAFPQKAVLLPPKEHLLGELVVCPKRIKKISKREGGSFEKRLVSVLIAGILEILSGGKKKEKGIKEKEKLYLEKLNF